MILKNKNAVVYGASGAIGKSVARAFAKEGASVFLTGRNLHALELTAEEITRTGESVHIAVVDALNGNSIADHLDDVIKKYGSIDVSFNAIGIPQTGVQGIPLLELSVEGFMHAITTYLTSNFLTTTAAAKHMVKKQKGVLLTLTATPSRLPAPLVGGMAPAWSAIESLTRTLAGELGPSGIRALCLRADGMPETETITEVFGLHAKGAGMPSHTDFQSLMESVTLLKRLPILSELANVATFMASDLASAITGTVVNVTCGSVID